MTTREEEQNGLWNALDEAFPSDIKLQINLNDEVTKLDTQSMIKPGELSLSNFEAYLDQNRTKLHIAHSHKQFHALLNK